MKIPFNKPYSTGSELTFIKDALDSGHVSGNGDFTGLCQNLLHDAFGYGRILLTNSCTDALEMGAMLIDIKPGDEVIVPAYTFVSTALAFARQGAKIIFADSRNDNPCMDEKQVEKLVTENTRAIVPVHYNGISCDMDHITGIAEKHGLYVIEDAAHAFGSRYKGKLLGTIGHLGCFSFHETKIIHCGEGGMLSVNDERFGKRAEIIWEKGTNRCDFRRGVVQKYEWIDTGSSFLMSEISAAFLYAQLQDFREIAERRKDQWESYLRSLKDLEDLGYITLPVIPRETITNHSGFYFTTRSGEVCRRLSEHLVNEGIQALTHYLDLGESPYIRENQHSYIQNPAQRNSKRYEKTLLRLPLYFDLANEEIDFIVEEIKFFFKNNADWMV